MTEHENVLWQADELPQQIEAIRAHVQYWTDRKTAVQVEKIASKPGPLHACLALSSAHQTRIGGTRAEVIAKAISFTNDHCPEDPIGKCVTRLYPLFRWDYGITAIDLGFDALGPEETGRLLVTAPDVLLAVMEAIWLVGLMQMSGFQDEACEAASSLRALPDDSDGSKMYLGKVGMVADRCFSELEKSLLGDSIDGWLKEAHRCRLWRNALVMAQHHRDAQSEGQSAFCKLLRHVRSGGVCPLPCEENSKFRERSPDACQASQRFWHQGSPRNMATELGDLTVAFLDDPLEILNVGNAFDTCLRLGGWSELLLLGWATNVNVRVVVACAEDGRMLGRRTIGLSLEDLPGVTQYTTYPRGNRVAARAISGFVDSFVEETGLEWSGGGQIENTCASACEDILLGTTDS